MASHLNHQRPTTVEEWAHLSNEVRRRWHTVSDHDIDQAAGDTEQLTDVIAQKTGEARDQIGELIHGMLESISQRLSGAQSCAADYSELGAEALRDGYDRAATELKERYRDAQDAVRRKPVESLLIAFGVGAAVGFALTAVSGLRQR